MPLPAEAPPIDILRIAEHLTEFGFIVLSKPLLSTLSAALLARCQDDAGEPFAAARIGRGLASKQRIDIRGDVIRWLDGLDAVDLAYMDWMEQLRLGLNGALYLGLFEYESHYAIYGAGAAYAKHSDVLSGQKNRILSTVLYLNEHWQANDGGELVLYEPGGKEIIATVKPQFGSMIIFLSETCPHEILQAKRQRRSIAGWFRGRGSG